ncbi:hypothetical protein NX722_03290 [Endozoicomonas gorgoniicola]|uniref:Uncharacterized protein n=1 Tax=Endozoicomonas gorgoniicola TaxID=1234144 RepID=A0ABT3MRC2_9GAMM|nr:hypothetical protein [Endozoicomonas gorgoniicola]MCW7551683.1 hypothetical protein [Endozoicomonas gorgoniicola]
MVGIARWKMHRPLSPACTELDLLSFSALLKATQNQKNLTTRTLKRMKTIHCTLATANAWFSRVPKARRVSEANELQPFVMRICFTRILLLGKNFATVAKPVEFFVSVRLTPSTSLF